MDIGEISQHLGMLQLCSTAPSQPKAAPPNAAPPAPAQAGWPCPTCTFINKPTRPGCEMCSTARPAAYVVPGSHRPDTSELWRMQQEEEGIVQYQQGRRDAGSAALCPRSSGSLDDFIHLSSEFG